MGGPSGDLDEAGFRRRTVYGKVSRQRVADVLRVFDFPDANRHGEGRDATTTPLQQLYFLNSPFLLARSAELADRIFDRQPSPPEFAGALYRAILAREPGRRRDRPGPRPGGEARAGPSRARPGPCSPRSCSSATSSSSSTDPPIRARTPLEPRSQPPGANPARLPRLAGLRGRRPGAVELPLLRRGDGGRLGPAALHPEGQAGDLPPDGGRPVAPRPARPQAGDRPERGPAARRRRPPDRARHRRPAALPLRVPELREQRDRGQRAIAAPSRVRGRPLRPPGCPRLEPQPRPGHQLHDLGPDRPDPPESRRLGLVRPGDREPKPARLRLAGQLVRLVAERLLCPASTRGRRSSSTSPAPTR